MNRRCRTAQPAGLPSARRTLCVGRVSFAVVSLGALDLACLADPGVLGRTSVAFATSAGESPNDDTDPTPSSTEGGDTTPPGAISSGGTSSSGGERPGERDSTSGDVRATAMATEGSTTASVSGGPPSPFPCLDRWYRLEVVLTPPSLVEVSSAFTEVDPRLDAEGKTIFFASDRPGGQGGLDLYAAVRVDATTTFGTPFLLSELNSPADDTSLSVLSGGTIAVFASVRPGGPGKTDVWWATRPDPAGPFDPPQPLPGASSPSEEFDPFPSSDGLRLYVTLPELASERRELMLAERSDLTSPFGAPRPLAELESAWIDANTTTSADERLVVWTSNRAGSVEGSFDIWYATRPSPDVPFFAPRPIPSVNTPDLENEPFVSPDGCELYFVSSRAGGPGEAGNWDVYHSHMVL